MTKEDLLHVLNYSDPHKAKIRLYEMALELLAERDAYRIMASKEIEVDAGAKRILGGK